MPEGDTILRAARTLARVFVGKTVLRFSSNKLPRARLAGATIVAVEAKGKHLLVRFDDGRTLVTHMRMTGSWHLYRTGERWMLGEEHARAVMEVDGFVAVCFDAPTVRLLMPSEAKNDPTLAQLGPDVLGVDFDGKMAVKRLRALDEKEIGDAILDQRAVAGIGNIYKSETLFLCRIDPRAKVKSLDDATLEAIVLRARKLMQANVTKPMRMTTTGRSAGRFWVYDRAGRPCRRCGARIERVRQSEIARSTYFCGKCQRSPEQ